MYADRTCKTPSNDDCVLKQKRSYDTNSLPVRLKTLRFGLNNGWKELSRLLLITNETVVGF